LSGLTKSRPFLETKKNFSHDAGAHPRHTVDKVLMQVPPSPWRAVLVLTLFSLGRPAHSQTITPLHPELAIGATAQLHLSTGEEAGVVWTSTDPRIAQVSESGLVTGIASGIAGILANYQGHTASTLVTTSMGNVSWSGPITITQGGTYSGNWRSTDPNTAAVTVATTEPVLIENAHITGPSDLIDDPYWGNNLTVKNVIGIGTNPNVSGQPFGMFVDAQNPILLDVENCYFENVHYGIWVRGYAGNRDGVQTITLLNNRGRNMLGLESNGRNGFLPGDQYWSWSHAIQLSNVSLVPNMRIAWNEIINYPYQSLVNEVINMYDSGGTASSPADIHDNFLQGAFPYDPATDSYNGGGFTTDGSAADTVTTASAYNNVYSNQVVGTVNMGIEFGAGHDNTAWNNTVLSSGLLPNQAKIPSQNVGLTVFDTYGNRPRGTMYNNDMHNNSVGWMCWAARCAWDGYRNDDYFPDDPTFYETNPALTTNPIPLSAETREYLKWLKKLAANGMTVGSANR
jgi:hypothetical protein